MKGNREQGRVRGLPGASGCSLQARGTYPSAVNDLEMGKSLQTQRTVREHDRWP